MGVVGLAGSWVAYCIEHWYMTIVAVLLAGISLLCVAKFILPARRLDKELAATIGALDNIHKRRNGHVVDLDEVGQVLSGAALSHSWKEYIKTLHSQSEDGENGQRRIVRWHATALADSFFSEQVIVDTHLKTEFYKHVPGILTGLGIIGTFLGLIVGLGRFKVPKDLTLVQEQLGQLIESVGHAFYVSAAAIFLAMLFTWIEKSLVAARYRQVESLRGLIDSLFEGSARETYLYLERMAAAAETSVTQAAHIKDALVVDLKEISSTLMTRQIEAQTQHTAQISAGVAAAIATGLGPPMEKITQAVQGMGVNQGEAVNKMLTDVLASFAAQMREIFGGQMQGMSDLLRETSATMKDVAGQFAQLVANMDTAGTRAVDAMGEKLIAALDGMEERQKAMNLEMSKFVGQIKAMVDASQTESAHKLQEVLATLGDQVEGVLTKLGRQGEESAKSTDKTISSISTLMEQLLSQSVKTNQSLQESVARLAEATGGAIAGMNSGAEKLSAAASDFAQAGQGVSGAMQAATAAVATIQGASSQLAHATEDARSLFADYGKTRDTFALMVSELKQIIENARRDASLTAGIIDQIETAAGQLGSAQKQSEDYLRGVSEVLVAAHEAFAQNVERTLGEGNRKFLAELSSAVQLLSGAIKNLGDTLDEIPARK